MFPVKHRGLFPIYFSNFQTNVMINFFQTTMSRNKAVRKYISTKINKSLFRLGHF